MAKSFNQDSYSEGWAQACAVISEALDDHQKQIRTVNDPVKRVLARKSDWIGRLGKEPPIIETEDENGGPST